MARKPKLRDFSIFPPNQTDVEELYNALRGTPPTTAAIVGAILVEHKLNRLLRTRFVRNDDETWEQMLGDGGPFSTFAQKITAAYEFGLIKPHTRNNLNTIRKLRNAFAHSAKLLHFNHPLIVEELKKFKPGPDMSDGNNQKIEGNRQRAHTQTEPAVLQKLFVGICQVTYGVLSQVSS